MSYCQYKLICLNCGSEITLVSIECNPIILKCFGCDEIIVVQNSQVYNLSEEFFSNILKKFDFKYCGQIVNVLIKKDAENSPNFPGNTEREPISEEDIKYLREFLDNSADSLDILKNI